MLQWNALRTISFHVMMWVVDILMMLLKALFYFFQQSYYVCYCSCYSFLFIKMINSKRKINLLVRTVYLTPLFFFQLTLYFSELLYLRIFSSLNTSLVSINTPLFVQYTSVTLILFFGRGGGRHFLFNRPDQSIKNSQETSRKAFCSCLNGLFSNRNMIIPKQFEFRAKHSTSYHLLKIIEDDRRWIQIRKNFGCSKFRSSIMSGTVDFLCEI